MNARSFSGRFVVSLVAVLGLGAGAAMGADRLADRYELSIDAQLYARCLPWKVFVVEKRPPERLEIGQLVAFERPPQAELLSDQFGIVKMVGALEGDRWRIEDDVLYLNGEVWGRLHLMRTLELAPGSKDGEGVVPEGWVMVLGTSPASYDSRYWGPMEVSRIRGSANVVF
jgi:conjugal transfer pilin signal peptidase TrbI